jgi:hypothetical protein
MVRRDPHRSFIREESGISLVEGMIVTPIVMLVFAAFVDFGYAMFQWNQTVKALQYGARLAAVSDSVASGFDPATASDAPSATDVGETIPIGGSWTCDGATLAGCDVAGLRRLVYGNVGETTCKTIGGSVRPAMCHFNPTRLELKNVTVTYQLSGLGYYGRPGGAIVTIRVAVKGITFDHLPIIGALLGTTNVTIPAMPVTITSEDLDTTTT